MKPCSYCGCCGGVVEWFGTLLCGWCAWRWLDDLPAVLFAEMDPDHWRAA